MTKTKKLHHKIHLHKWLPGKQTLSKLLILLCLIIGLQATSLAADPSESKLGDYQSDTIEVLTQKSKNRLANEETKFVQEDLETKVLPQVLKFIFATSSFLIMIIFIYAGIKLVVSQGEEEELKTTKNMLIYSIIGAIIIMTSYGLVIGLAGYLSALNT